MAKIAIIGTGFVADYYATTLANHPRLSVAGVFDRDSARLEAFAAFHGFNVYPSAEVLFADPTIEIIVNLTTPESHYAINLAALNAGKHVYCEKPLGMTPDEAGEVIELAAEKGLIVAGAPANALSDAQALVAGLIADGRIGAPRLIYAEMEDGAVFKDNWREWRSISGARWPGLHEFEIGCTLEHAGYGLSWLITLFGPVKTVHAFSALTFPDKGPGTEGIRLGPDYSVGSLEFASGPVARITCGLAAPRDRSLTIIGDEGTIIVRDLWDHRSPVNLSRFGETKPLIERALGWIERKRGRTLPFQLIPGRVIPYQKTDQRKLPSYPSQIDFAAGIDALASAVEAGEAPFFSGARARHLTELALALNSGAGRVELDTDF